MMASRPCCRRRPSCALSRRLWTDAGVVEVSNPLAHPENPMQDRHIEEKFIPLVEPALGKARCGAALEAWWDLEQANRVSAAMQLLEIDR